MQEALDRLREAEEGSAGWGGQDGAPGAGVGSGLEKERAGWAGF